MKPATGQSGKNDSGQRRSVRKRWSAALTIALLAALFVAGRFVDVQGWILMARETVSGLGYWGGLLYGLAFVLATLLMIPGTPFTILAALLFGPWLAFVIMTFATTLSAVIAFLLARYLAKEWVERRLRRGGKLEQLKGLTEQNRAFVIPAIRFLPMFPYSFNNYALGLTRISFGSYLFWSEVVLIPMNIVLILGAHALYRSLIVGEFSWGLIGGATAAGAAVFALGYFARKRLG